VATAPDAAARGRAQRGQLPWHVVGVAVVALMLTAPGQTAGVSVFVDPMIESLGLTRAESSGAYMVGTLVGALALPRIGRALDRWGVRAVMAAVGGAFGLAAAAMAGVTGLVTLVAGYAGIRLLGQGSLSLSATTSVAVAFARRRGLAMGLTMAAGSALLGLMPLALTAAIDGLGWQRAWIAAGATVALVVVPLALLGLRGVDTRGQGDDEPEAADPGTTTDADHAPDAPDAPDATEEKESRAPRDATRREALRTPAFWAIVGGTVASGLIGTGLQFHQISLLGEQGLTVEQAAANFVPQSVTLVLATLATGWLADRVSHRVIVPAAMGLLMAAMLLSQVAAPGFLAVLYAIGVGGSGGATRAYEAAAMPRYFGTTNVGAIRGAAMTINVMATALGPVALATGFEAAGTYAASLLPLLALPVLVAALALLTRPPAVRG